ncbi:MAG: LemA family protein [Candidatus Pedobacter colombiensis]|uniref:LemA family protein n=1 Tax=Candidatus Pedobacter colombiensis TaxID=3121371 RepID=A0AAJ5W7H1_9SPHI|nr:LemA family protein [Pedobacter sp.]WEK19462.1 MAG: LemA family protein [Pedobacter sp.]
MIVALIVLIVIALVGIGLYNSLIGKKNQVNNAFSAIDVMLKKRFDLLPNLIETVKQYMNYEEGLLGKIVELRSKAVTGNISNEEKLEIDRQLSTSMKGLMVNVENYPDLKANHSFINLQTTWTESEEQIAAARRTYNASVTDYNNAIMMFPGSIVAGIMNYQAIDVLTNTEEERKNISAKELFNS